jgi:hypothetical protein
VGEHLTDLDLMGVSAGPSGELYALAVTSPADTREVTASGASIPRIRTDHPQDVVVLRFDGRRVARLEIPDQTWNYHHAQPLPDGELLLVCARSRYRSADDYDLNGKVFAGNGVLKREFLLGDGLQDVQTTADGRIWTSYFDEGVFGNFGWDDPVGKHGLVQWDGLGNRLWEYSPPAGLGWIADCYALNAISGDEVWCTYYTGFPLVCIRGQQVRASWESPVRGSDRFAIWREWVLFRGGYDDGDRYHLFALMEDGTMEGRAVYRFCDEQGRVLHADRVTGRGRVLFLIQGTACYRVDVAELVG